MGPTTGPLERCCCTLNRVCRDGAIVATKTASGRRKIRVPTFRIGSTAFSGCGPDALFQGGGGSKRARRKKSHSPIRVFRYWKRGGFSFQKTRGLCCAMEGSRNRHGPSILSKLGNQGMERQGRSGHEVPGSGKCRKQRISVVLDGSFSKD